jgi:DegV family protein with EDD domain
MPRIAVITDTDASISLSLAEKLSIQQVPIIIQFGEESFRAVYDIDDVMAFSRIDSSGRIPTTSAPSPGQFSQEFKHAFELGAEGILCFTVSSEVSATYAAAITASGDFPGRDISVIDTKSLSMGQGFQVLYAAEALYGGASKDEAIEIAKSVGERTHFFAALSTLKYLAMSGRVGKITAGFANMLNVKPILTIQNGKLDMLERVRTQSKAWARLIELTKEKANGHSIERMAIAHVAAASSALKFESLLRENIACPDEITHCELTPGLSVHSGAGLVGVAIVLSKDRFKGVI